MDNVYLILSELEEILLIISSLKDKTLDSYKEDTSLARDLLIDLSSLEAEAGNLIQEFHLLK
jgi:hypothetical protein